MSDTTDRVGGAFGPLDGDGEMAARIRTHDWTASLGAIHAWPQSLRSVVALLVHSPLPMVLLWGEDGVMIYNDGYAVVAGGRHPEILGSKVRESWPEAADFNDNVMRVGLAGGKLAYKDQEFTLFRSGKPEQVWLSLDYSPVFDESGKPAGVIAIVIETTERVLADAALRDLNAMLEQRVGERTAELMVTEEALRQAQKMEAIGQLTGGIAHDFNNLLAGISGSLELLAKRLAEGQVGTVERYISAAQASTRRAASLTQRLLAFSRRQTLDPRPTDINRLIAGMEDLVRRTVGPTVDVEVVGAGGLWTTRIDPSQLENALLNLCINGRDAMAPDGGRLTIETANRWLDDHAARVREIPPGQFISLSVTDTGAGMTPEVIARAFDPFFTTKPLGAGTGLGLSMIYGFVRQSGGQVRIYSELGKGTTVCLYLPRHVGDPKGPEEAEEIGGVDPGAGETVLVIDDEPILRALMVEVLEEAGYRVIEASDGPSGLHVLQTDRRIDLVVTDVGLPGGLNGRQVADAARALRPDLKVLFITGFAENAAVGNGFLEPGMEVITKPFVMVAFVNKLRELLDR